MLLPTSLVGSYTQPDWLIDDVKLAGRFPPRVRETVLWRESHSSRFATALEGVALDRLGEPNPVPPERLVIAPDCGLNCLSREVAFGKTKAMAEGTGLVRAELV